MQMEIRKYIFLGMMDNTSILCRRKACIHMRKMNTSHTLTQNRCWYQKVFPNNIKSFGYIGGRRKLPLQYAEDRPWPSRQDTRTSAHMIIKTALWISPQTRITLEYMIQRNISAQPVQYIQAYKESLICIIETWT